jgi:hypothetical protein
MDIAINITGLIGLACISFIAWQANKYGHLSARLKTSKAAQESDDDYKKALAIAESKLESIRDSWTPRKSKLLYFGTVFAVISYALGLYQAVSKAIFY